MVASRILPNGDLACNPGMCPNWGLNQQPLDSQAGAQTTGSHQPGMLRGFYHLATMINTAVDVGSVNPVLHNVPQAGMVDL